MRNITGVHHVTMMTSQAEKIYDFFTYILGMRLVKKTINQDDIHTYHLFFADDKGNPGTDVTFFDFPSQMKAVKGTDELAKTGLRVSSDQALEYWLKRFNHHEIKNEGIKAYFNMKVLPFYDFDEQEYFLVSDENQGYMPVGEPWKKGPVPDEYQIIGLGPIYMRVSNIEQMSKALIESLLLELKEQDNSLYLFETKVGGNNGRIIVEYTPVMKRGMQGYGGIHHVAFRISDLNMLNEWQDYLNNIGAPNSGYVDRFYFKSLYTRLYPRILFEFATEGPGFIDDEEDYETLGEKLALPPRFRAHRTQIESLVRQFDTVRSTKVFLKEYD